MAGFESAYVALSRMKQHVQVYTDNRQGWTDAINNAVQKGTAHDVFEPKPDREVMNAERLFSTARELRDVTAGRAVLRQAGLAGGDSPARFIAPGRKYPQPYVALPAFDRNGKSAGIWLNPLTTDDGNGLRGFSGEGRVSAMCPGTAISRLVVIVTAFPKRCVVSRYRYEYRWMTSCGSTVMRNWWPHIASVRHRLAGRQCRSITPRSGSRSVRWNIDH